MEQKCIRNCKGKKIGISDNEMATAALVGVEEFKPFAVELLDLMNEQPLLRYKFFLLVRDMQTRAGIKKNLLNMKLLGVKETLTELTVQGIKCSSG